MSFSRIYPVVKTSETINDGDSIGYGFTFLYIFPEVGKYISDISLRKEDFPEPLCPIKAIFSPL